MWKHCRYLVTVDSTQYMGVKFVLLNVIELDIPGTYCGVAGEFDVSLLMHRPIISVSFLH